MKFDSVSLLAGCIADNITIISGAALPAGSIGEFGVKVTIQGQEVTALTGREDRSIYLQAAQLGAANKTWKFGGNTWLVLSQADLNTIVTAVLDHVQTSFAEEAAKAAEIDACTTLAQLDAIVLPSNGPVLP